MSAPVGFSNIFPAMQILNALAIICLLIPAPIHFKGGNPGVILFICWVLAGNIIFFVDSIIWRGNIRNPAVLYCDIVAFILAIITTAVPCTTLCMNLRLWKLCRMKTVIVTKSQKRKDLVIDLLIGLGIPFTVGGMHAIVQGNRYNIFEDIGCIPTTYSVWPAFLLYWMWPLIISIISAVFGILAILQFLKLRHDFDQILNSTHSREKRNHYLRLLILCSVDLIVFIPVYTYNILDNALNHSVHPWISWAEVQYDWYRVDSFRRITIDQVPYIRVQVIQLIASVGILGIWFFIMFGFTGEAIRSYICFYYWVLKSFGVKRPAQTPPLYHPPSKRTWLDKLLGREAKPPPGFSTAIISLTAVTNQTKTGSSFKHGNISISTSQTHPIDEEEDRRSERTKVGGDLHYKIAYAI